MVPMHKLASNFHCGIKKQNQTVQQNNQPNNNNNQQNTTKKKGWTFLRGLSINLSVKLWDVNTWHWSQAAMHKALANSRE